MSSRYSPFPGKEIDELEAADLSKLSDVREGWYVEYKRDLPNPRKIAKSLAAFPNTYGGWLFIGVEEKSKTENVAGSCPGIPRNEIDAAQQAIRQSASSYLNPCPHFEVKILWGPNLDMGLGIDRAVICVEIPSSPLAPIVHSDGVIYRRIADASEPKSEADRHQLELLWDRRNKIHKDYKRWIEREPERSQGEQNAPYLRLLLDADLYRAKGQSWDLSIEQVKAVLDDRGAGPSLPFDSFYYSSLGIVARQTSLLTCLEDFGLTWIIGRGLRCEVWVPINVFVSENFAKHLSHYRHIDRFADALKSAKSGKSRVIDLNQVFSVMSATMCIYLKLLAGAGVKVSAFHAKVILGAVWRTIPFLDSPTMLSRMERYGVPLVLTNDAVAPSGSSADSFQEIGVPGTIEVEDLRPVVCAAFVFELVCRALGLQGLVLDTGTADDKTIELLRELVDAGKRAKAVLDT